MSEHDNKQREPFLTQSAAKKHYRQLYASSSKDDRHIWNELRNLDPGVEYGEDGMPVFPNEKKNKTETGKFSDLRGLLEDQDYRTLEKFFLEIDLTQEETKDLDGSTNDSAAVFARVGADLKEFNPRYFNINNNFKPGYWSEITAYRDFLKDEPDEYFNYLYDIKVLFPEKFGGLKEAIPNSMLRSAIGILNDSMQKNEFGRFLKLSDSMKEVVPAYFDNNVRISEAFWKKCLEFINSFKGKGFLHGEFSAMAQFVKPEGFDTVVVTPDDWDGYVKDIRDRYESEKKPDLLVSRARALKYLKIGA